MRYLTSFLFTILLVASVQAQDAESYFHRGANSYINSQLNQAIQIVDEGLFQYPNDSKLNSLKQKLEEEKEKQQQQQQNQQNQNQDQQEQEQDQQEQNQDQQQENQEQNEDQQQDQEQGEGAEENEPKPQEGKEVNSKEISKEDAEKILKALAQKEKELLKDFKKKKSKDSATHDKDW
jgi:membrane protein involved in colicin uptake